LQQLETCGLRSDQPVVYQTQRIHLYQAALDKLIASGHAYPCACSRKDIEQSLQRSGQTKPRHGELIYPSTCRNGLQGRRPRVWRLRVSDEAVQWTDRRLGAQQQNVAAEVGDFILKRADGCHAYQLAVVVDDAAQGVTDVVRGEDLADNTARQILLQRALGLPSPRYLHTPLVLGADGSKLSKQNGAQALDLSDPLAALNLAAAALALPPYAGGISDALVTWVARWALLRHIKGNHQAT
jgi:glutamyl-Q tRNA(Asp) synthetase